MTWPNIITLARLLSVPGIIWLIMVEWYVEALWAILLAGASDLLDGFLARSLKSYSMIGAYLDPLADKVLLMSVYSVLTYKGLVPIWLMLAVILRDILILVGITILWIMKQSIKMRPLNISKFNTACQIFTIMGVLLDKSYKILPLLSINMLFILTLCTTFLSALGYIKVFMNSKKLNSKEDL